MLPRYSVPCLDTGLVKIGITNSLDKRISTLENPRHLELELHKRYQQFRPNVGREFFELSEQQIKDLIEELQ